MKNYFEMVISSLNKEFARLSPEDRLLKLEDIFSKNEVLFTSSFGITSVFLLHLISRIRPEQIVHFINTTYLFKETLEYKEKLSALLNLEVVELLPDFNNNAFTYFDRTWEKDSNLCCTVNKIMPLSAIKGKYSVWISGILGHQNAIRSGKNIFEWEDGILKFYPLIDQSPEDVSLYIRRHNLPHHPLYQFGYHSVGCVHCTAIGCGREGRWKGNNKTECGLHQASIRKAS